MPWSSLAETKMARLDDHHVATCTNTRCTHPRCAGAYLLNLYVQARCIIVQRKPCTRYTPRQMVFFAEAAKRTGNPPVVCPVTQQSLI